MQTYYMTIDGAPVQSERVIEVFNPATGQPFAMVAAGNSSHVDQAVVAARAAFPAWSALSDVDRKAHVMRLAELLEANMPELMELITMETGKPLGGLNNVGSGMEVGGAIAWTRGTASLNMPMNVIQDDAVARIEVHRRPLGVVGSITPWNWPLMICIWHIMPALQAGNTVVLKPASLTPVTTLRFVELANRLLPKGVLNVITGDAEVGSAMSTHPGIAKMVFTGSTPTGRRIMGDAAATLKRLTLELGGNDAGIVLSDVDPVAIAPKLFGAAFHNNGQTCACLKRLYVPDTLYEPLVAELVRLAQSVVVGNGLDSATQLGPVQNLAQRNIVHALVEDACRKGARVAAGGASLPGDGYFYMPTIIADARAGMRIVDEEQFGPALPIIRYHDIEDAIAQANASENGLGGSVWSQDISLAARIAQRLECGTAWVNEHGAVRPDAPFGGVKQSGIGVEFGLYGFEEYVSLQTVMVMKR